MATAEPEPQNILAESGGFALVARGFEAPGYCAVTHDIDGPFIDTGVITDFHEGRIYLHAPWVEQVARDLLGMVPKADYEALLERVEGFEEKLAQVDNVRSLVAKRDEVDRELEDVIA